MEPKEAGYDTLHDVILANEYQTSPELSINRISAKSTPDLSNTAPIITWQEKRGEETTLKAIKPASSAIKSDSQTGNLTDDDTKIKLFTKINFNSDTANYTLSNPIIVDPTEIIFDENTHYYFKSEIISYNNSTDKLYTASTSSNRTVYEITGASKIDTKTIWNKKEYDSITYTLKAITLTGVELEVNNSDKGLYQGTDDYGTTYYYRGNVNNNNVYFAGFYWQIVRINGDGSIRLIYNGTEKNATGAKQSINNKTYQFNNKYNDPAYVGYMYGNQDGTNFAEVQANTNSSTIKIAIEDWYKTNIEDKGYSSYISKTAGFCGDRSLYSGDGISTSSHSYFGPYGRYLKNIAQFTCPEPSRDLYTTISSSIGNKALTYPVGLIIYDEIVFAGMDTKHVNKLSWIYSSYYNWTMSPSNFNAAGGDAYEWVENSSGYLATSWNVASNFGARPVINLKADVKISGGIGTSNDPYVIETN